MIRSGDMAAVSRLIRILGIEAKNTIKSVLEISYWSRGAWSYEEIMRMSAAERSLAVEFLDDRFEKAKKMKSFQTFF